MILLIGTVQTAEGQDLKNRLQLGHELERAGRWFEARALYEALYKQYPDDALVFNRLKDLTIINQDFDRAMVLIEERRKKFPDPQLDVAMGQIKYKMGDRDEALHLWKAVLELHPKNPSVYHAVANAMSMERLLDEAIDVYEKGRSRIGNPDLFVLNLVNLYTVRMNFDKATSGLLDYFHNHPKHISIVEGYLLRFPKSTRVIKEVEKQFKQAIKQNPKERGLRQILVSFYLKAERFEKALSESRAMESISTKAERGQALYRFAQQTFRSGAPDKAASAYQEIISNYTDFPMADQVYFGLAQCEEAQENFAEAITAYQQVFERFSKSYLSRRALLKKGAIQRDILFDVSGAIETFSQLQNRYPKSAESVEGQLALAQCFISLGELNRAKRVYNGSARVRSKQKDPVWVRATVGLADVYYLEADYDSSMAVLDALAEGQLMPKSYQDDAFNDGLNLRLLLKKHGNPESGIVYLSKCDQMLRQRRYKTALTNVDSLLLMETSKLHPEAFFKKGEIFLQMDDLNNGSAAFDSLVSKFPNHLLADRALEYMGWAKERSGDIKAALAIYETILTNYPQSFQADEIRKRIRSIEKEL